MLNPQEPVQFKVIDDLNTYLQALPEYEAWGNGSAKSVAHLWEEIRLGESVITQEGARKVRVVVGELRQSTTSDLRLVELEQTLSDGRKRVRSRRPMAEKIIANENPMAALERGLLEELNLKSGDYALISPTPEASLTSRLSDSYPGMLSHYERYIFQVVSSGLPQEDFTITEPDGIRSATWGWRQSTNGE